MGASVGRLSRRFSALAKKEVATAYTIAESDSYRESFDFAAQSTVFPFGASVKNPPLHSRQSGESHAGSLRLPKVCSCPIVKLK